MVEKLKPYPEYQPSEYDWLGNVPVHWGARSVRSLTKLSDERNGNRSDLELLSVYREYGVIRKDSRDDNHNTESLNLSNYKYVGQNYLVMNKMKMWQGSLGISRFEGIVSPAYLVCTFKEEHNYSYLQHLLRSAKFKTQYNRISYGIRVGQWDMRYDDFKQVNLHLPPPIEQNQISVFLDYKVALIHKFIKEKKREIILLKEQKQAEINQAVTRGVNPNVKMKDSGISWIGEIPSHWEIFHLRGLIKMTSIKNMAHLPLLSVVREKGVIMRDLINDKNHNFVPDDLSGYKSVKKGDFVINKMKAWQGSCGVSNFDGIVSPAYYTFELDFENNDYFNLAIRSKVYVNFFTQYSGGIRVGQWDLSSEKLKSIPFFVPPIEEQIQIEEFLRIKEEQINRAISAIEKEIKLIQDYKTTLISDVVTGKVDVRNVVVESIENETEEELEEIEVTEDLENSEE